MCLAHGHLDTFNTNWDIIVYYKNNVNKGLEYIVNLFLLSVGNILYP